MSDNPGSRRQILALLCIADQTVNELARELGISANAVRKTLARLEEQGLVRYEAVRRGVGKPAHQYRITAEGEQLLSSAYLPMLRALADVLREHLPAAQLEEVLRAAGRKLAAQTEKPSGDVRKRARHAVAVLGAYGGEASVRAERGSIRIECTCCAIGALVMEEPAACKAMEAMLAELLGTPVQEHCIRSGRPSCRFHIADAERPGRM